VLLTARVALVQVCVLGASALLMLALLLLVRCVFLLAVLASLLLRMSMAARGRL
jgi:hypothetical protein